MSSYKLKGVVRNPYLGLCDSFSSKEIIENSFYDVMKNRFEEKYKLTVGLDINTVDISIQDNELITCCLWNIGEQKRFEFIRNVYYKGASFGIIFRDKHSWKNNQNYREEIEKARKEMEMGEVDIIGFIDYDSKKYSLEDNKKPYLRELRNDFKESLKELSNIVIEEKKKERITHQASLDELLKEKKPDIQDNTDIITDNGVISKDEDGCELVLHFEDMSMEDVTKVVTDLYKRDKGVEIHIKPDGDNYIVRANYKKRKKNSEGIRGFSDY